MNSSQTHPAGLFLLICSAISSAAVAKSPLQERSDYVPSVALIQAGKQYDDCVRSAAREFSSAPDGTPVIVEKAERRCHLQRAQLQEQGRIDGTDPVSKVPDLKRQVDLFVNQSMAGTRVSAFVEVSTAR